MHRITIWLSIVIASGGTLGCLVIFILWTIDATTGWRVGISPRLSTATVSDRVAWLSFSIGLPVMLWIVYMAVTGEGDGEFVASGMKSGERPACFSPRDSSRLRCPSLLQFGSR